MNNEPICIAILFFRTFCFCSFVPKYLTKALYLQLCKLSYLMHQTTGISTPILFLVFNRPEQTIRVFNETIKKVKPKQLFISADGPRSDRPGEAELCEKTRKITDLIDWDCEVKTRFLSENLGCRKGVSSGISWFFDQVQEGIILEDDCLVDLSFFQFAGELLEKYRDHEEVMHISASNFQIESKNLPYSYYFSRYNHIWGWASWQRAWKNHYHLNLEQINRDKFKQLLVNLFPRKAERSYFLAMFDYVRKETFTSWDYQWTFSMWYAGGFSITPAKNLISNIGFGEGATNTQKVDEAFSRQKAFSIPFPLIHPPVEINETLDSITAEELFRVSENTRSFNLKIKLASLLSPQLRNRIKKFI